MKVTSVEVIDMGAVFHALVLDWDFFVVTIVVHLREPDAL
jgi:hypothetical protein